MERVIIDCDTGQDDAVAILMAAGSSKIKIEGIVSVAGNQILENTLENNLKLTEDINLDVPVFKGLNGPLVRKQVCASHIHGKTGLDGPIFSKKRVKREAGDGVDFIIDTIMNNPNEINLVAIGPLTDIAIAIKKEPRIVENVKKIVLMGGAMGEGNVTPCAEFNVYADPEAASIVFSSKAPIYMMGLDVTKQLILDEKRFDRFKEAQKYYPNRKREIFIDCMEFYIASCIACIHEYPAMHDPCCIAYLINPEIFSFEKRDIFVETKGEYTYGQTVADFINENSNTFVGVRAQQDKFWDLLFNSLN